MPTIKSKAHSSQKQKALEELFWQIKLAKMPELETEVRFHPSRLWRIDYGYEALKVGLEYEGGVWGVGKACKVCKRRQPGRHTTGQGAINDCEKYNEASIAGWILIRANDNTIKDGLTFNQLKRAYEIRTGGVHDGAVEAGQGRGGRVYEEGAGSLNPGGVCERADPPTYSRGVLRRIYPSQVREVR